MSNKKQIKICKGMSCSSKQANIIEQKLKDNSNFEVEACNCTGHCYKGANIRAGDKVIHNITPENVIKEIENPTDFSDGNTQELDFDLDKLTEL